MKTRKLNKKGEVNWYLIAFILSVAVLVLMFWGPLGSWWKQLSDKYDFFQKSVDARLQDLELFGPSGFKQEDLNYIAQKGSLDEIKKTLEVYKKEIENKCIEDTGFKSYVERVENSAIGTDISSDSEKWNEYSNFRKFACDRLYDCLKDDKKTDQQISNNLLYFSKECRDIEYIKKIEQDPVKTRIKNLFDNKDIGTKLCREFSISSLPIFDHYLEECRKFILIKQLNVGCSKSTITLLLTAEVKLETTSSNNQPFSLTIFCKDLECSREYKLLTGYHGYKVTARSLSILDERQGTLNC